MHVVATAGHVDHGKSTLVRALTGMEPDRWESERRRGLTIDLGYAWTMLESGRQVAFVDVPGHERFVGNMLAGVGPVPLVLFVVAADEGWKPQSTEHLDALDALGVHSGLLVVSRCDLADPRPARAEALDRLAGTSLAGLDCLCVSARTGAGMGNLRDRLERLVAAAPVPDPAAPVRLWVDRVFTIRGAGTVVTGTLPAGTVATGDSLVHEPSGTAVEIRGMQALDEPVPQATGVARVALNLRGVDRAALRRGDALVTPQAWTAADLIDVRVQAADRAALSGTIVLHIGSASLPVRFRPLGGGFARLRLPRPLPLHIGDVALLRDPAAHRIVAGVQVLDVVPPELRRRGAAAARAGELRASPGVPGPLLREGVIRRARLDAAGGRADGLYEVGSGWLADPARWEAWAARLPELVARYAADHPLDAGMPLDTARRELGLPDVELVQGLVAPPLAVQGGQIVAADRARAVPEPMRGALAQLREELADRPFVAPEAYRLQSLGLGRAELAALTRAGALRHFGAGIYLLPGAEEAAVRVLAGLPAPFTLSEARKALGTTRRVAVPLLEWLDAHGYTTRLPDATRRLRER